MLPQLLRLLVSANLALLLQGHCRDMKLGESSGGQWGKKTVSIFESFQSLIHWKMEWAVEQLSTGVQSLSPTQFMQKACLQPCFSLWTSHWPGGETIKLSQLLIKAQRIFSFWYFLVVCLRSMMPFFHFGFFYWMCGRHIFTSRSRCLAACPRLSVQFFTTTWQASELFAWLPSINEFSGRGEGKVGLSSSLII